MAWGTGPKLDLMGAIREALERNLELQIERYNTEIQQEQVGLARSFLLPQIGLSTGIDLIDDNRADKEPGSPARSTWSASGEINQSVYSDDIWANYSIQQLLLESEKYMEKSTSFDTIITAAKACINLLFAVSSQEIQNTNLSVTRKNLDIVQAGYSEGRNTVADLIDAQNSKTSSERAAAIAKYQLVLDSLVLERSIGRFHFLDSPEDKAHFISRLSEYKDMK